MAVFPTDTFYGLGGDGFSLNVIRRVYALKGRPGSKPLLVLVSGTDMAEGLTMKPPPLFRTAAERFWPGPLTIVLRAAPHVPRELCGGTDAVAVRLPAVPWLRDLVRETGFPVIATSANLSGEAEISDAEEAKRVFAGQVDLIVDGGTTPGGKPSTVLDLSSDRPRILREGSIPAAALKEALGF